MGCTEFTKYKSLDEIKGWLKRNLNEERYEHTLGTADMAERQAEMLNLDKNKAKLAGRIMAWAKRCIDRELF